MYTHEKSVYDGDMQDHKWHPECLGANAEYHRIEGEGEFDRHSFQRGTIHEATYAANPQPSNKSNESDKR